MMSEKTQLNIQVHGSKNAFLYRATTTLQNNKVLLSTRTVTTKVPWQPYVVPLPNFIFNDRVKVLLVLIRGTLTCIFKLWIRIHADRSQLCSINCFCAGNRRTRKPSSSHTNGHNFKTIIKPQYLPMAHAFVSDSQIVDLYDN